VSQLSLDKGHIGVPNCSSVLIIPVLSVVFLIKLQLQSCIFEVVDRLMIVTYFSVYSQINICAVVEALCRPIVDEGSFSSA